MVNVYSWPGLTELACSNDDPDSGCAFGASASVSVVAGHEYVIRVAGEGGGFGAATLETWSICLADITWDGFVNGDDFDYYSMLFEDADPDADLNADGFVNGNDYDIFAEHFDLGC